MFNKKLRNELLSEIADNRFDTAKVKSLQADHTMKIDELQKEIDNLRVELKIATSLHATIIGIDSEYTYTKPVSMNQVVQQVLEDLGYTLEYREAAFVLGEVDEQE